jgi:hypothetical protein
MLSWILQITIISIVLIFLVHYLFNFFKSTLTVPKIKDLVNTPTQKYENMFNIISKSNTDSILSANLGGNTTANNNVNNVNNVNNEYTLIDLLPNQETKTDMKNELKNFLKKQMNTTNDTNNTTSISALDSMMSNSYSEFT